MNERELEREEKKLELEIKKAAKMGNKQVLTNIRETIALHFYLSCTFFQVQNIVAHLPFVAGIPAILLIH